MNKVEKQLLENIFDALDRLFDNQCKVIDLYALIYATEKALKNSFTNVELSDYANNLNEIIRSGESEHIQREEALEITNNLRSELNELLLI